MLSLYDFGVEVMKIREAADSLTVTGVSNAAKVVLIFDKCNQLIQTINEISATQQNPPEYGQNGTETSEEYLMTDEEVEMEEGEVNGEPDSGTAT